MGKQPIVMVVDDNPASLAATSGVLSTAGYEVRPVDSSDPALAASASPTDLIL
jgi:CheY-like chemotaxis protein